MSTLRAAARRWGGLAVGILSMIAMLVTHVIHIPAPPGLSTRIVSERFLARDIWPDLPLKVVPDEEGTALGLTPANVGDIVYTVIEIRNTGDRALDWTRDLLQGFRVELRGEGAVLGVWTVVRQLHDWRDLAEIETAIARDRKSFSVTTDFLVPRETVRLGIAHTGSEESLELVARQRGADALSFDQDQFKEFRGLVLRLTWNRAVPIAIAIAVFVMALGIVGTSIPWWKSTLVGCLLGSAAAAGAALLTMAAILPVDPDWLVLHNEWLELAQPILSALVAGVALGVLAKRANGPSLRGPSGPE